MEDNVAATALSRLKSGKSPGNEKIISDITVGLDFLTEFWRKEYLSEYIPRGGSRIQFITGRRGSGKSHLLEYFLSGSGNYKKVYFSARKVWINDFKEIFFEILKQCDIEGCLRRCGESVMKEMGFSPEDVNPVGSLTDYLTRLGLNDPFTKREIRLQLNKCFLQNPLMDNNFAIACGLLAGGQLGHPILEEPGREALLGWLGGSKDIKLATLRALGMSPSRVTKHNARHMLRSLVEVVKMAGYNGIIVAVDDLDILVGKDSLEEIRYTKQKRDDVYESVRELIDEIDSLRNIFFLFAFDRRLIDDERYGIKSYQALWFRIQNEIHSDRLNRFSNMIDMDRLPVYDVKSIIEMSARVAEIMNQSGERFTPRSLREDEALDILSKSGISEISLPRRVVIATIGSEEGEAYGF